MSDAPDHLERDQDDFFARLSSDSYFAEVTVLQQNKGVTEDDINQALGTLNEKVGKIGAVSIVLMPELIPSEPDAPGPEYRVRATVQVIVTPLFNDGDQGTGKSAEAIARRGRQLLHRFNGGTGVWSFAGMEPIERPGDVSYGVVFTRVARDEDLPRQPLPIITPDEGAAPQVIAVEAAAGAAIYYTLDGSYPWSGNDAAVLYSGPIDVDEAAELRAVAYKAGFQPSNVALATYD